MNGFVRTLFAVPLALAVVLPASAAEKKAAGTVRVEADVPYVAGTGADAEREKLDLYLPAGKDFPVLLFLHGGGFQKGDRKDVAALGKAFAANGVGVAAVGYRLYPGAKHPAQIEDVARAFAWLKENVSRYGGRADALFVGGHSAGGHLAALLATDPQYLKAAGAGAKDVRGVVVLSGAYRVPEGRADVFGDEAARKAASPINHVAAGLPPFLLAYADKDSPGRDRATRQFADALQGSGVPVELIEVKDRDHGSLFTKASADDQAGKAVLQFIHQHLPEGARK